MFSLLFVVFLYFLPAILGRDKSDATGIFLLNLFLGWTLIGWVAAFIWAIAILLVVGFIALVIYLRRQNVRRKTGRSGVDS